MTVEKHVWAFKTWGDAAISASLSGLTILLNFVLTIAYPDTLPGPTYLVSLICWVPFLLSCWLLRYSYIHIYLMSLVVMVLWGALLAQGTGAAFHLGAGIGVGFWIPLGASLHLWTKICRIDVLFIARITALFGIYWFTMSMLYGHLTSIGIQFFRSPFMLQPISVFGFGSLELLITFTNGAVAWWIFTGIKTKSFLPIRIIAWYRNPIFFLVGFWVLWLGIAGIIKLAHKDIGSVRVATVTGETGAEIADAFERTKAAFVVAPEGILSGESESCESQIEKDILPKMKKFQNVFLVIGCVRPNTDRLDGCSSDNLAYTVSSDNGIIDVYGKLQPTMWEQSCWKNGIKSIDFSSKMVSNNLQTDSLSFKFSSVVCYDADFSGPIAKAADKGSSLILNPANDWTDVRHHFAVAVIRAVENRVAIVKAEKSIDPVIVDPFGNVLARGTGAHDSNLEGEVKISRPLKISWLRQQAPYWLCIVGYAVFVGLDIWMLVQRRRRERQTLLLNTSSD